MINFEEQLRKYVKKSISNEIDDAINEKIEEFRKQLLSNKERYLAEIMRGIRIMQVQKNPYDNYIDYRIVIENRSNNGQ